MPWIDLTDDELLALTIAARKALVEDRYPLSPRLAPLRSALAKLDPSSVPKAHTALQSRSLRPPTHSRGGRRRGARR
jgi:hypothetical protein